MSLELLKTIEQAEAQADSIRQDASRRARELVVEADKRGAEEEARAVNRRRQEAQNILRQAQETSERRIAGLAKQQQIERETVCNAARRKLDAAASLIFERIVGDGNR